MVVETMKKEHLSIYAAMQEFGINDHKIIERWERIYLAEVQRLRAENEYLKNLQALVLEDERRQHKKRW